MNQGSAGRPGVYAPAEVSDQVLPGWRSLDPGQLDVIEVGRSVPGQNGSVGVPFRVITIDGDENRNVAIVRDGRITGLTTSDVIAIRLPSEGGPGIDSVPGIDWLIALGVAGLLILLTWTLMDAVRRSPTRAGDA